MCRLHVDTLLFHEGTSACRLISAEILEPAADRCQGKTVLSPTTENGSFNLYSSSASH